ncbi:hypothetical protein EV714DRAFT_276708 [Schizophyllum commune]
MSVKALAEAAISQNTICVFSRSWCPYCTRVKSLLDTRFPNAQRKYLELDKMDDGDVKARPASARFRTSSSGKSTSVNDGAVDEGHAADDLDDNDIHELHMRINSSLQPSC